MTKPIKIGVEFRQRADGTGGCRVFDTETGREITGIQSVHLEAINGSLPRLRLELIPTYFNLNATEDSAPPITFNDERTRVIDLDGGDGQGASE